MFATFVTILSPFFLKYYLTQIRASSVIAGPMKCRVRIMWGCLLGGKASILFIAFYRWQIPGGVFSGRKKLSTTKSFCLAQKLSKSILIFGLRAKIKTREKSIFSLVFLLRLLYFSVSATLYYFNPSSCNFTISNFQ